MNGFVHELVMNFQEMYLNVIFDSKYSLLYNISSVESLKRFPES